MCRILTTLCEYVLLFIFVAISPLVGATGSESYVQRQGDVVSLGEKLTFRAEYSGIAGKTGVEIIVAPAGDWQIKRFREVKGREIPPTAIKSGTLSPEEITQIGEVLANQRFAHLPRTIGTAKKVNPQRYALMYGDRKIALEGYSTEPGKPLGAQIEKLLKAGRSAPESAKRFVTIVSQLEALTLEKEETNTEEEQK